MKKQLLSLAAFITASLLTAAQTTSSGDLTLNYLGYSSGVYLISINVNVPNCSPTIRINWNGRSQDSVITLNSGTNNLSLPGAYMGDKPIRIKSSSSCASSNGWLQLSPVTVLPVKLAGFDVTKLNGIVTLKWTTATEDNVSRFVIERSSDGINFVTLRGTAARGPGTTYVEQDQSPVPGKNYYRIRTIDIDSKSSYSSIRVIASTATDVDVVIMDYSGRIIAKGKDSLIRGLPPGTYVIQCTSGLDTWQEKLAIR